MCNRVPQKVVPTAWASTVSSELSAHRRRAWRGHRSARRAQPSRCSSPAPSETPTPSPPDPTPIPEILEGTRQASAQLDFIAFVPGTKPVCREQKPVRSHHIQAVSNRGKGVGEAVVQLAVLSGGGAQINYRGGKCRPNFRKRGA